MSKIKFPSLAAALGLAIAFTLSCSDDKGGGGAKITKAKITGVSQKGPFIKGASADLYELNGDLSPTGKVFPGIIADDWGKFEIKGVELASPYAMLRADGKYRSEMTGQVSDAPIKLYAITDITDKDNVNINILTHLEYHRVMKLVEGGKMSVRDAKKQAQNEILAVFGISGEFGNSEDMSIFGTDEGNAALLAISVMLQGDLSEGEFDKRISDFSLEFAENGTWDNEAEKLKITDWTSSFTYWRVEFCVYNHDYANNCWKMPTNDNCNSGELVLNCLGNKKDTIKEESYIRSNILGWGLSAEVPDFGKYVRGYYNAFLNAYLNENYGLNCDASNEGEKKNVYLYHPLSGYSPTYVFCMDNAWRSDRDNYPNCFCPGCNINVKRNKEDWICEQWEESQTLKSLPLN